MNPKMDSSSDVSDDGGSSRMSPVTSNACLLDQDTYRKLMDVNFDQQSDDSSDSEGGGGVHFFEGAEKRLVLYLADIQRALGASVGAEKQNEIPDLRTISRDSWEKMLNLVNCQILNVITNDHHDAYLLSESSMFVSRDRVIIKTCGTTTLLHCLEHLLQLVKKAGFESIEDLFYSHKNLLVPSLQMHPHHSFLKESEHLDKMFNGLSHLFGHVNSDRFYLYTMDNKYDLSHVNEHWRFEIIMENLDEKVMGLFIRPVHDGVVNESITAAEITRKSGIDKLVPGMVIDDFLFMPCGYSMNGLFGEYYMTIHITPEPGFSYVSLEMNIPQTNYPNFIRKVLSLFKPGKFMVNLTAPDLRQVAAKAKQRLLNGVNGQGYSVDRGASTPLPDTDPDELANIHGLMVYEDILEAKFAKFRRCDLQLAHYKHSDIIYARYAPDIS